MRKQTTIVVIGALRVKRTTKEDMQIADYMNIIIRGHNMLYTDDGAGMGTDLYFMMITNLAQVPV